MDKKVQIYPAKDMRMIQILMGITMCVVGLFGPVFMIGFGVLMIILSCIAKYDQYITLGSDYIIIKAPIGAKTQILFDEINSIDNNNKKITLYYTIAGTEKVKKAVIALNLLTEADKIELIQSIEQLNKNRRV